MDFSFFSIDNKSGYKTREVWFSKNYPNEYSEIINYSKKINLNLSFKEKLLFYFKNMTERPKCLTCGKEIKFRERFDTPYGDFCSLKCINENKEEMIKRQKSTFNKKYGINFYPEHIDFITKLRKTKKERYGNENYNNSEKNKKTRLERYGNENYVNINKCKSTSFDKYGFTNPSKNEKVKEKIKNTNIFRYGYNSPTENPLIKQKLRQTILSKIKENFSDKSFLNYNFETKEYELKCVKCEKEFKISMPLYNERKRNNTTICIHCNPIGIESKSQMEIDLTNNIKEIYYNEIQTNTRKVINGEIDIYIPEKNLAIELNGVYWHNELFNNEVYHLDKTTQCNNLGIHLIHIFEDEWINKSNIVKSIIKNNLGLTTSKIFARKCKIKEVPNNITKLFLENNHIQGNVNSKIRLGLYFEGELVSLMTFSKGRVIMGGKENEWELTRFCNKIDTNVIGGANKLFQQFLKLYNPNKVISYSDVRLFKGEMYEKLGFKKIHQSKPSYWYVINGLRYYRFNFRKSILVKQGFDPNKTEKEIMFERKIYRIYDCGNIRWEFNKV
jgi:hypothetical protein